MNEQQYGNGTAVLSDDGMYRFLLTRELDTEPVHRTLTFVMLNPSTADAANDDATIRKCTGYALRNKFNKIQVVNLFAYRTVSPDVLRQAHRDGIDVVGRGNLTYVDEALRTGQVVCAWGANAATCPPSPVSIMLANWSQPMWCLGLTKDDHPKHPSRGGYVQFERWSPNLPTKEGA